MEWSNAQPILTSIGAFLGGVAVVTGAFAALLRHYAQTEADRQRRITESFSKAVEQLGSDKIETRLGAVYTLERISRESAQDYWVVMETLTAFVRERTRWKEADPNTSESVARLYEEEAKRHTGSPNTDIAAVLTVIGRREEKNRSREKEENWIFDFGGCDLQGAVLIGAHLEGASFRGAHLERISLNRAHLEGADLWEAHLVGATLGEAHLEGANLGFVHLEGAGLGSTHLEGAYLCFAHLEGARLGETHLEGANLAEAHLEGAYLSGAHLKGANLSEAEMRNAQNLSQDQLDQACGINVKVDPPLTFTDKPPTQFSNPPRTRPATERLVRREPAAHLDLRRRLRWSPSRKR